MFCGLSHFSLTLILLFSSAVCICAQADAATRSGVPQKEDLPVSIQESLAKQRIEREKKDFAELLEHGREAIKITGELEKSFGETYQILVEDKKKLDRLEKVLKKIRREIGAGDGAEEIEISNEPLSVMNALKQMKDTSIKLVDELDKTTRYSVSVIAVESSNLLLKVVKFLRTGKNLDK